MIDQLGPTHRQSKLVGDPDPAIENRELDNLVEAEMVRAVYQKALAPGLAILANAGLVVFVLWDVFDHTLLLGWYGAHALLTLFRGALVLAFRRAEPTAEQMQRWGNAFSMGAFLSGCLWGSAGPLFFDSANPEYQIFVVFVIGGMAAGSSVSHASYPPAFLSYVIPSMLPVFVRFAIESGRLYIAMAIMLALFTVFVTMITTIGGRSFVEAIRLRFQNAALAAELARRSEEALSRFRALLDEAGAAIIVARSADLRIVDANKGAVELMGQPRTSLTGVSLGELDALETVFSDFSTVLEVAREKGGATALGTRRDEEQGLRQVELNVVVRELEDDEYILLVSRDVTEQKNLEAQLVRSNLLASVGSLAAGVAHEINNPLAYVSANLNFVLGELRQSGAASEELAAALLESIEGADRIRAIVRDLTPLARGETTALEAVDTQQVIQSSLNVASKEIRHRAQLHVDHGEAPAAIADAARLGQVILNLLINAGQAIEEGDVASNSVTVRTRHDMDHVLIEVSDTGSGIPEDIRPRVFDPFFTTKPVGAGTGLGLSICHSLVRDMGGEITFESEVGKGTTFRIKLRASDQEVSTKPSESAPQTRSTSGRILVIDDEEHVARSLRRVLKSFDVTIAESGADALEQIRHGQFDAVICDLMMPDMTGMEIYELVERELPGKERSMVFLTGGAVTPGAQAFLDRIENPCVHKPFDAKELEAVVRSQFQ